MRFAIQIQSYNRFDMLCALINSLQAQRPQYPIIVVDDCSTDKRYKTLRKKFKNVYIAKTRVNGGKQMYWKTVTKGLRLSRSLEWDFICFLADDLFISKDFFNKLEKECDKYNVVNFFNTGFKSMWGLTQYVDGAFACHRKFFESINFVIPRIHPSRWRKNKNLSSGVWYMVTKLLNGNGYKIKMMKNSLVDHMGNEDSKMNPHARRAVPISSKTKVEGEIIYNVELNGIGARFFGEGMGDLIESYWASGNFYEPDVLMAFSTLNIIGKEIIDAGSHRGNHAIFFSKFTDCKVLAFEPFEENYAWLKKNVKLNSQTKIKCINKALGDRDDKVYIENTGTNTGMPKLSDKGQEVEQTFIDKFTGKDRIAAIKIDTEGNEINVINGAEGTIRRDKPVLVVETDQPKAVKELIEIYAEKEYNQSVSLGKTPTYIYSPK